MLYYFFSHCGKINHLKNRRFNTMSLKNIIVCFTGLAIILGLIACGNGTSETESKVPTDQPSKTPSQASDAPQLAAGSGKVVQKMDASIYTYILLDDGAGNETWAAVPNTNLEIGEQITLKGGMVVRNFSSKTLNRTFDSIIFAAGVIRANGDKSIKTKALTMAGADVNQSEIPAHDLTPQTPGGHATVPFSKLKVEKSTAQNGYTVGELFAKGASLNNQKVTVRGQVVKVNHDIMGKNWLHIQDGTGDFAKNTHDLVVTSSDIAEKGAIISIEGTLAADKDFGFGYKYDVIVEDAVLMK
jgi:DNA/RNA endonuclease YhcR with UshA esterase domain